jgi:hypothetical protein
MQAQDFSGATWAVGLRSTRATESTLDRAFDDGAIVRTHVLRPTWHFVAPADLRWLLALTRSRVHAFNAYYYRQQELDAATLATSHAIFERALRDGRTLTRAELAAALSRAGIAASGLRLGLIVMHAELEAVICSGPRRGKQFTYALLDERIAATRSRSRDAALGELARRYFTSHGPATARDCGWWSSLTLADVARAIEIAGTALEARTIGGRTYWARRGGTIATVPRGTCVHLLSIYDEYTIAYKDRAAIAADRGGARAVEALRRQDFMNPVIVDGRLAGTWRRDLSRDRVAIDVRPARPLSRAERAGLERAMATYGAFLERDVHSRVLARTSSAPPTRDRANR